MGLQLVSMLVRSRGVRFRKTKSYWYFRGLRAFSDAVKEAEHCHLRRSLSKAQEVLGTTFGPNASLCYLPSTAGLTSFDIWWGVATKSDPYCDYQLPFWAWHFWNAGYYVLYKESERKKQTNTKFVCVEPWQELHCFPFHSTSRPALAAGYLL